MLMGFALLPGLLNLGPGTASQCGQDAPEAVRVNEASEFLRFEADGRTNAHNREVPRPNKAAQRGRVKVQGIGGLRHGEQLQNSRILLVLTHLSPPRVALALAKTGNSQLPEAWAA